MVESKALSIGQESLWLLHRLAPESAAYNLAGGARMSPAPDVPVLARAVRAVFARHDGLRSVFTEIDGEPRRVIRDAGADVLEVRDVPGADDATLARLVQDVIRTPFVLSENVGFRAVLLRRRDDAVLLMVTHHIVTDAISQWLLWRDLIAAYQAHCDGVEVGWPALRADYDDFVTRERLLLDSPSGERMAAYWRDVCAGTVAAELPTDRPRPPWPAFDGASLARRLPDEVAARIPVTAAQLGVSPFALLLGTFQALLYRHCQQRDFVIGCPASTRRSSAADVVGYYVNPILLRARFTCSTSFADAATAANAQIRQGMARAAYPFPLVARTAENSPPFRVSVTMVNADRFGDVLNRAVAGETMTVGGLRMTYLELPHMEGQCDLAVEFTQDAEALLVVFRYDTDLFEAETINRLLDQFTVLAEVATATPRTHVVRVPAGATAGA